MEEGPAELKARTTRGAACLAGTGVLGTQRRTQSRDSTSRKGHQPAEAVTEGENCA